jgi:hypothetical protein
MFHKATAKSGNGLSRTYNICFYFGEYICLPQRHEGTRNAEGSHEGTKARRMVLGLKQSRIILNTPAHHGSYFLYFLVPSCLRGNYKNKNATNTIHGVMTNDQILYEEI